MRILRRLTASIALNPLKRYTEYAHVLGGLMAYKLDGAKFETLDELVEALFPLYSDKMSEEEFKKYAEENAEKT